MPPKFKPGQPITISPEDFSRMIESGELRRVPEEELQPQEPNPDTKHGKEQHEALERFYQETKERFGESFLGIEEVETAFTLNDGTKLIDLSPEQKNHALLLLKEKLNEPDIQEFLKHIPQEELQRDFLLIFHPPTLTTKEGTIVPITMQALEEHIAPDMLARGQDKLLHEQEKSTRWYVKPPAKPFYATESVTEPYWTIQTKTTVRFTSSRPHTQQTAIFKAKAQLLHLDPTKIRRRTPREILLDRSISLRAKNTRLVVGEWDWTDTPSSSGRFVSVGGFGASGAGVEGFDPAFHDSPLGASFSR